MENDLCSGMIRLKRHTDYDKFSEQVQRGVLNMSRAFQEFARLVIYECHEYAHTLS